MGICGVHMDATLCDAHIYEWNIVDYTLTTIKSFYGCIWDFELLEISIKYSQD